MTRMYVAEDGNYGDAEGILIVEDLESLGLPLGVLLDNTSDSHRLRLARLAVENQAILRTVCAQYHRLEGDIEAVAGQEALVFVVAELLELDTEEAETFIRECD